MDSDSEIPTLIPLDTPTLVDRPAVPVTIITGFLGSGKTTLITSLLADPTLTTRIAVILNEFGSSAGIDKSLSMNAQGQVTEEWLELANGCLCCSVKYSLFTQGLWRQSDREPAEITASIRLCPP